MALNTFRVRTRRRRYAAFRSPNRECSTRSDARAEGADAFGERAVGRDDGRATTDRRRVSTSSTMRSSAASRTGPARVRDEHAVVYAFRQVGQRAPVEHDRDSFAGRAARAPAARSTSRRVAPGRSRHQPSGRLPITLLPSTMIRRRASGATRWCSPARARVDETCAVRPVDVEHFGADRTSKPGPGRRRARAGARRARASRAAASRRTTAGSRTCAHLSAPMTTTS